ncbi:islet cell autoantigen 1-like protein [Leptotrombidium deliense]|uniref:Islet cell autoantigen 1-like protein n=1 Tax=Leptotrombidium deliense TaxID=299467 RepID=A0A443SDJ5_9ACAR|nr:islet cell autoantigen 1-like protein [Leptotrombidium deliense]
MNLLRCDRNRNAYQNNDFDRFDKRSALSRIQQQYWETKQTLIRKLKKKEDDCIVNSDHELDTKLELFHCIEETCANLLLILEGYQDRLCTLSYEESAFGRFLKECGKIDKTRAGKMMSASGKTLSYTAQQRILLRSPLIRLYQEVETFQYRAITDTFTTIEKMEKARNAYRGALLWMKNVSQELDPDTFKQMEKFRKVQSHVRKTKAKFDKLKMDTLQKIDMLSASRCNMLSHALVAYQNSLLFFWEKSAKTMNSIAESFRGYQYYEFNLLKELSEPNKKLAEETANGSKLFEGDFDKDKLIFFDAEYHDDDDEIVAKSEETARSVNDEQLVELENQNQKPTVQDELRKKKVEDLFASHMQSDDLNLLQEFMTSPPNITPTDMSTSESFMSHFWNTDQSLLSNINVQKLNSVEESKVDKSQSKKTKESEWFNLFAELDPLANPDAIGKMGDDDRNC